MERLAGDLEDEADRLADLLAEASAELQARR
jgi:hypothetical protein